MVKEKKKEAPAAPVKAAKAKASAPACAPAAPSAPAVSQGIAPEIVAAISAAIAASEGVGAVSIRSIRVKSPAGRNPWSAAAIAENARPF